MQYDKGTLAIMYGGRVKENKLYTKIYFFLGQVCMLCICVDVGVGVWHLLLFHAQPTDMYIVTTSAFYIKDHNNHIPCSCLWFLIACTNEPPCGRPLHLHCLLVIQVHCIAKTMRTPDHCWTPYSKKHIHYYGVSPPSTALTASNLSESFSARFWNMTMGTFREL